MITRKQLIQHGGPEYIPRNQPKPPSPNEGDPLDRILSRYHTSGQPTMRIPYGIRTYLRVLRLRAMKHNLGTQS